MYLNLKRFLQNSNSTLGVLSLFSSNDKLLAVFSTLELPNRDNQRNISCIPAGLYTCVPRVSKKYGKHWLVADVPNRSLILLHHGNFSTDTQGCILVGKTFTDVNQDGFLDVSQSRLAMSELISLAGSQNLTLTIQN